MNDFNNLTEAVRKEVLLVKSELESEIKKQEELLRAFQPLESQLSVSFLPFVQLITIWF